MEAVFFRYRVLIVVVSVFLLVYAPFEIYRAIEILYTGQTYQGIGILLNALLTLVFVPVYFLISVRKAYKKYKDEEIFGE